MTVELLTSLAEIEEEASALCDNVTGHSRRSVVNPVKLKLGAWCVHTGARKAAGLELTSWRGLPGQGDAPVPH